MTLGFNGGEVVAVNSNCQVQASWGYGRGVAVVRTDDLAALLQPGNLVVLDFYLSGWEAWSDSAEVVMRKTMGLEAVQGRKFEYYQGNSKESK